MYTQPPEHTRTHGRSGGNRNRELLLARVAVELGRERVFASDDQLQEFHAKHMCRERHFSSFPNPKTSAGTVYARAILLRGRARLALKLASHPGPTHIGVGPGVGQRPRRLERSCDVSMYCRN